MEGNMRYQKKSRKQMTEELIAKISGKETIVKVPVVGPVAVKLFETPEVVVEKIVIPKVANIIVMEDKPKKKRFMEEYKNVK